MKPALYLVPNLLGVVPPADVLPERTLSIARAITHWVVETPKAARAFLATIGTSTPIRALAIEAIGESPADADLARWLVPTREGHGVGMLSDAGCPGIADPGARLVAFAQSAGIDVVPLVGPSSLPLALMASGLEGQRFAFHGYLPAKPDARAAAIRGLEAASRAHRATQAFIETPYRNVAMIESLLSTLADATRLCVAVDLTLPSESVRTRQVGAWRRVDASRYDKRPAIFLFEA